MNIHSARKGFIGCLFATCLWGVSTQSGAEDIDLFLGPAQSGSEISIPNVLFVIDNTANWTNIFTEEMGALQEVFESLPSGEIRVGILMYSESGGANKGIDGGYVRAAIRTMIDAEGGLVSTKELYSDLIGGLDSNDDKSNSGKSAKAMAEAYFYFAGKAPQAGSRKSKTDYEGNTFNSDGGASKAVWALDPDDYGPNALEGFNTRPYNSPVIDGSCGGNYIIYVGNGPAQDSNADNSVAGGWLRDELGEAPTVIDLGSAKASANWADEWTQFMRNDPDLAVKTFTIDINRKPRAGQGPNWTLLLKSMALESGGVYYDLTGEEEFDADDLKGAINDALSRILAVDSLFTSVALPLSSGTKSEFFNNLFVGIFRPDEDARPRWPGNLKLYRFARIDGGSGPVRLVDADAAEVIDLDTDLVNECVRSYWTEANDGSRQADWAFRGDDDEQCIVGGSSADYDTPDGPHVHKGAQGHVMRESDPADRVVYTCSSTVGDCDSSGDALTDFKSGSFPSTADLGVPAGDRSDYINWTVGFDLDDVNEDGDTDDMRPYVHGGVVHSQPLAVSLAAADPNDPQIVVFYGADDGMLHAINGDRSADLDPGGSAALVSAGGEIWSFMPPEFFDSIKILRNSDAATTDAEIIKFPSSGAHAPATGISKPYGMDGPLTMHESDTNGDGDIDERWLFAAMRRGGRFLYAFDVSTVGSPALKWKKGCDAGGTCNDADYSDIGQTWSPARVISAAGFDGGNSPLLIMGGGYDECEDFDNDNVGTAKNHNCASATTGNVIYVIDADDGSVLKTFTTDRAVPGEIAIVDTDSDNDDFDIKYAYATDAGGNMYRISGGTISVPEEIGSTAPASWVMTKIASLGCASINSTDTSDPTCTANRKFLFGPDVVEDPEVPGRIVILEGTGDREKPLIDYGSALAVNNYFFAVFDRPLEADWLDDDADNTCGVDMICLNALTDLDLDGLAGLAAGEEVSIKGWKFALAAGEQAINGALTLANLVGFGTHIPRPVVQDSCDSNLGTATAYEVNYLTGGGEKNEIPNGGLLPPVWGGLVILDPDAEGNQETVAIKVGGPDGKLVPAEVSSGASWSQPKNRVYWNIKQ